jgi:hypothetical protein
MDNCGAVVHEEALDARILIINQPYADNIKVQNSILAVFLSELAYAHVSCEMPFDFSKTIGRSLTRDERTHNTSAIQSHVRFRWKCNFASKFTGRDLPIRIFPKRLMHPSSDYKLLRMASAVRGNGWGGRSTDAYIW